MALYSAKTRVAKTWYGYMVNMKLLETSSWKWMLGNFRDTFLIFLGYKDTEMSAYHVDSGPCQECE